MYLLPWFSRASTGTDSIRILRTRIVTYKTVIPLVPGFWATRVHGFCFCFASASSGSLDLDLVRDHSGIPNPFVSPTPSLVRWR